jgi:hypothetical protein
MLADDIAAALPEMRLQAESLMRDAGELRGPDVNGPIDEASGQYTKVPGVLKYAGKAKVQTTDAIGNDAEAGDRVMVQTRFRVDIPVSAAAAAVDDIFTVTSSAFDPELVGCRFRVASLVHKTYLTARRLAVEEVQS